MAGSNVLSWGHVRVFVSVPFPGTVVTYLTSNSVIITGYEIAYARSPPNMKALVMAVFLFMNALSSALGEILTPAIADPHLIWVWAGPAIALAAQTIIFWWKYHWMNKDEFLTLEDEEETARLNPIADRTGSFSVQHEKEKDMGSK